MRPTVITGFSGGGFADVGYLAAGYEPIGAVEYEPDIAEVYRANVGDHVRRESIMDTDWRTFDRPDLLHMSPECKEFSQAKSGGKEGPIQRAQAEAICRALEVLTPPTFVLENVVGYRRSDYSLPRILRTLERLGYCYDLANINCADFGVPQTRRRLILRAVKGGLVPHLPAPVRWVGWYAAIADLLPTLPESAFAPWQLARLPECLSDSVLAHPNADNPRFPAPRGDQPAFTIATYQAGTPRALIVHPTNTRAMTIRAGDEPLWTLGANSHDESHAPGPRPRAFIVDDQHGAQLRGEDGRGLTNRQAADPVFTVQAGSNKPARAWLDQGRVVAMTPRALARFQSVPDTYVLPEARGLACKVIGNGVPPLLSRAIGESLLGVLAAHVTA